MKLKVPELLSHVVLSKEDLNEILPNLRNWTTLMSSYSDLSEHELEKYIVVELNHKSRESYIKRLMTRYAPYLRGRLEHQIHELMPETPHEYIQRVTAEMGYEDTAA